MKRTTIALLLAIAVLTFCLLACDPPTPIVEQDAPADSVYLDAGDVWAAKRARATEEAGR